MLTRRSSEREIKKYLSENLDVTELKKLIENINENLDDGEEYLSKSGGKAQLISQILEIKNGDIIDSLDELGLNGIDEDEDFEDLSFEDMDEDFADDDIDERSKIEESYFRGLRLGNIDLQYEKILNKFRDERYTFSQTISQRELYPYQKTIVQKLKSNISRSNVECGFEMPTGSGKTFTLARYIYENFLNNNRNILIVAPTWEILSQHASTYCQGFREGKSRVRRYGGKSTILSPFKEFNGESGVIVLSTGNSIYKNIKKIGYDLLVIDEAHWGNGPGRKMLPTILKHAKASHLPVIHMTATWTDYLSKTANCLHSYKYVDLVPTYLSRCNVRRLDTGEKFNPQFTDRSQKILRRDCIREISNRKSRVKKIIEKCDLEGWIKGPTMYFAGSIEEAQLAYDELAKRGYECGLVHSKWANNKNKINAVQIERFRKGELQILINVQMLTMGFDVPSIETIIVARPVESSILFAQICGRGARKTASKSEFTIVDVHDVVAEKFRSLFEHSHIYKTTNRISVKSNDTNSTDLTKDTSQIYHYDPDGTLINLSETLPLVGGFPIRDGQSFGFEFELTWDGFGQNDSKDIRRCKELGAILLNEIGKAIGSDNVAKSAYDDVATAKNMTLWNSEWDGSAGVEVTTRVLMGETGVAELIRGIEAIQRVKNKEGLKFNSRTGCHLHLGWKANDTEHASKFLKLWCNLEIGLYNILAPSRLYEFDSSSDGYLDSPNPYAVPMVYAIKGKKLGNKLGDSLINALSNFEAPNRSVDDPKYLSINWKNIDGRLGTVEFRALHGTDDPQLIVSWLSLCMTALHRSRQIDDGKMESPDINGLPQVGSTVENLKEILTKPNYLHLHESCTLLRYFFEKRIPESLANWKKRAIKRVA